MTPTPIHLSADAGTEPGGTTPSGTAAQCAASDAQVQRWGEYRARLEVDAAPIVSRRSASACRQHLILVSPRGVSEPIRSELAADAIASIKISRWPQMDPVGRSVPKMLPNQLRKSAPDGNALDLHCNRRARSHLAAGVHYPVAKGSSQRLRQGTRPTLSGSARSVLSAWAREYASHAGLPRGSRRTHQPGRTGVASWATSGDREQSCGEFSQVERAGSPHSRGLDGRRSAAGRCHDGDTGARSSGLSCAGLRRLKRWHAASHFS